MKKLNLLFLILAINICSFGQSVMQASIGLGPEVNVFKIYLKASAPFSNITASTVQWSVGIPAATLPVPTLNIVTQPFLGGYQVSPPYSEGGYILYDLTSVNSGPVSFATTTEVEALTFSFTGGPSGLTDVSLVTLPAGGIITGNALFLYTSTLGSGVGSVEGQLYYARAGTVVLNNLSYTGALPSFVTLTNVLLPLKLTNFNVTKQNNDGYLTWILQNQDATADHFIIERSFNGVDFVDVGTVQCTNVASGDVPYHFTDLNIISLRKEIIYYRIKSLDKNGAILYTEIKNVKFSDSKLGASLFPNPAKSFTNLSFETKESGKVHVTILDAAGKIVSRQDFQAQAGANKKQIITDSYAAGNYTILLQSGDENTKLSFIKTN